MITDGNSARRYLSHPTRCLPLAGFRLCAAATIFNTGCRTHHALNCRLLNLFTISQHIFFSFYFRAALCVFRCLDTRLEELSASLLAERLKPLFPKQSGADRPGLLVMACCPHRGSARAKQVSNGGKNACSLVHLTVHGLRNLCRGALPPVRVLCLPASEIRRSVQVTAFLLEHTSCKWLKASWRPCPDGRMIEPPPAASHLVGVLQHEQPA